MTHAYFAPLVLLPTVITEAGNYVTRCGETVTIERSSAKHDFGNRGFYANAEGRVTDSWHRSGRVNASRESNNDVVGRAELVGLTNQADAVIDAGTELAGHV